MGFSGFMWVSLFLFCFPFGLLQVLENFSCWVVGVSRDGRRLLLWATPVIQETGSERVRNSLRVLPVVSGKARIKARSIRTQTWCG